MINKTDLKFEVVIFYDKHEETNNFYRRKRY